GSNLLRAESRQAYADQSTGKTIDSTNEDVSTTKRYRVARPINEVEEDAFLLLAVQEANKQLAQEKGQR
ncbi:MAG: hypothetical protein IKX88_07575, partial [Thermoguttaceae bacterium]|nr:hypothetical protein [Thermoguttaceae bacterium]